MTDKKHIYDVQPATVDEHFQLLLNCKEEIDPKFVKVTPDIYQNGTMKNYSKKVKNFVWIIY